MSTHLALLAIIDSDLAPAAERTATRLLTMTEWLPSGTGSTVITWPDFEVLSNCTNHRAARRHLTAMQTAGLIHYSTVDNVIYVHWTCTIRPQIQYHPTTDPVPRDHRSSAPDPAAPETLAPNQYHQRADPVPSDHRSSDTGVHTTHTRDLGGGGGDIYSLPDDETTTTNHSAAVIALLQDIGLQPRTIRIHCDLSDDDVGSIIDAWERDVADNQVGIGALIHRLRTGSTPPNIETIKRRVQSEKYTVPDELRGILIT